MHAYTATTLSSKDGRIVSSIAKGIAASIRNSGGTSFIFVKATDTKLPTMGALPSLVKRDDGQYYLEEEIGIVSPSPQPNEKRKMVITRNGEKSCLFHIVLWTLRGGISQEFIRPGVRVISEVLADKHIALLAIFARGDKVRAKIIVDGMRTEYFSLSCCNQTGELVVENDGSAVVSRTMVTPSSA